MGFLAKLFGPRSKYDRSLPYTYEARVPTLVDDGEYKSYFSDTVCGLVMHLDSLGIRSDEARLLEIYRERETPIDTRLLTTPTGEWLSRSELCRAFEEHYKGHIHERGCSFEDRERHAIGP